MGCETETLTSLVEKLPFDPEEESEQDPPLNPLRVLVVILSWPEDLETTSLVYSDNKLEMRILKRSPKF